MALKPIISLGAATKAYGGTLMLSLENPFFAIISNIRKKSGSILKSTGSDAQDALANLEIEVLKNQTNET